MGVVAFLSAKTQFQCCHIPLKKTIQLVRGYPLVLAGNRTCACAHDDSRILQYFLLIRPYHHYTDTNRAHHLPLQSSTGTVIPESSSDTNNITQRPTLAHKPSSPRTIFPWRHSSAVLPRIDPNSTEYFQQGGLLGPKMPPLNSFARNVLWASSCRALQIPFWDIFISQHWQRELSESFVLAFQQAVNGLLVHTLHGTLDLYYILYCEVLFLYHIYN